VTGPDGTVSEVKVWNATVANLTLMALGSSAPEIILSVIEILSLSFYAGDLGPSTIVGSAAFNLLMITAACIVAIPPDSTPDGRTGLRGIRSIADMGVFTVTCTWGIFAYVWLLIILLLPPTPNVCSFYEGLLTFLFFPITVQMAYMADRGMFSKTKVSPQSKIVGVGGMSEAGVDRGVEILKRLDGLNLTVEEKAKLMVSMASGNKPSRAQLRMQATRLMTGGKRVLAPPPNKALLSKFAKGSGGGTTFFFGDAEGNYCTKYAVLESEKCLVVHVMRAPATGAATIKYKSVDFPGGAKAGEDYVGVDGVLTFAAGETTKDVEINILDDDAVEEDEKFHLCIYEPSEPEAQVDNGGIAEITIVDDDEPGEVGFEVADKFAIVKQSVGETFVVVKRFNGSSGAITVKYRTEVTKFATPLDGSGKVAAVEGVDFEAASGSLTFAAGQIEKKFPVKILNAGVGDGKPKHAAFEVVLFDCVGPIGGRACLTDNFTSQVAIVDDADHQKAVMDIAAKIQAENDEKYSVETTSWSGQFSDALQIERDDGDEGKAWTALPKGTVAMHFITVPWKVVFAVVPPTVHYNGWATFGVALAMIGLVTGLIGDLAGLFGCSIGMPDSVIAITFVALGTSLPDTFASMAAAQADDSADAAIGNVTGSNAVNVFLGLGMPWLMASCFWGFGSPDQAAKEEWILKYASDATIYEQYVEGNVIGDVTPAFVVLAGALGPSVSIFCVCALACVALLMYRRQTVGGELGGDPVLAKKHAVFSAGLWLVYIIGSILTTS